MPKLEPITSLTKAQKKEQMARLLRRQVQQPEQAKPVVQIPELQPGMETVSQMPGFQGPPEMEPEQEQRLEIPDNLPVRDSAELSVPPAAELAAYAAQADQFWRDIGGSRSLAGKLWEKLADDKKYPGDPRDYFISTFLKYKMDDQSFRKVFPTEASLFDQIEAQFDESLLPDAPVAQAPPSPIPGIPGLPPRPPMAPVAEPMAQPGLGPMPSPIPSIPGLPPRPQGGGGSGALG